MQDIFRKICLGVIAVSLATIAYVQVSDHQNKTAMQNVASTTKPAKRPVDSKRCAQMLREGRITLATLEDQIKNVPSTVQTEDADGNVTGEKPNRLYEQLMLQIVLTKTEIEDLTAQCGS